MDDARIAGRVPVAEAMNHLARTRPVFHSEADFQFAFAQAVARLDAEIDQRLEVRQPGERREYVDLVCRHADRRTLIEFKYVTRRWTGEDESGESFSLRDHAAMDLARQSFIHDVFRLERFVDGATGTDGLAILLTNCPSLWEPPTPRSATARDLNFRLHQARSLQGHLVWGSGDAPAHDRTLRGSYVADWRDYVALPGSGGSFRWLGWQISRPDAC